MTWNFSVWNWFKWTFIHKTLQNSKQLQNVILCVLELPYIIIIGYRLPWQHDLLLCIYACVNSYLIFVYNDVANLNFKKYVIYNPWCLYLKL